jgi:hypothetical protein
MRRAGSGFLRRPFGIRLGAALRFFKRGKPAKHATVLLGIKKRATPDDPIKIAAT